MDKKEGFGTLYLTNGEKFAGNFEEDEAKGFGNFYKINGEVISGYWENNLFVRKAQQK